MEYTFNQFRLDPKRKLFYQDNKLIETDARTLALIQLLLQRYPETIPRRELMESLWQDQEISDAALSQLIHRARVLLGDDGQSPVYIKTIHGVGVRFLVTPIQAEASDATHSPRNKNAFPRWWLALPVILLTWLGIQYFQPVDEALAELGNYPYAIAVLPFENNSGNEDHAWVNLGLMDMVGQLLSEPAGIKTIATKNVLTYLTNNPVNEIFADPKNMQQAFNRLCNAMGCQVLLAARLDNSASPKQLSYQIATKKGVYPIKIAQGKTVVEAGSNLAQELVKLLDPAQPWVVNSRDTYSADDAANRAYALGAQELSNGNTKAAIQYLNIALQKVPDFHWAKAKLADALYRVYDLDQSTQVVETLLATQNIPDDIRYQALKVQSNLLYTQGKNTDSRRISEALLDLAIKMDAPILQGNQLMNIGTSYQADGDAAQALICLKQAEQQFRKAQFKPGIGKVLFNIGNVHSATNSNSEASDYYQKAELLFQQLGQQRYVAMTRFQQAVILIASKQLGKAKKMLHDLLPLFEKLGDKQSVALAKIDSAYIEILEAHYDLAIQQLLALLPQLEEQQLTYAIGQAKIRLAQAYLNQHQPEAARAYLEQEPEEPIDSPGDLLTFAHLAYEEHRFADAVGIAKRAKKATDAAWLAEHEALLDAYQAALASGEWKEAIF